jgi:hypothetical protein
VLNRHRHRQYLYALAVIILLLQSFAVWHDTEHPFHTTEAQCERLNAINHLPFADITPELAITLHVATVTLASPSYSFSLPVTARQQHAIRAPPVFS